MPDTAVEEQPPQQGTPPQQGGGQDDPVQRYLKKYGAPKPATPPTDPVTAYQQKYGVTPKAATPPAPDSAGLARAKAEEGEAGSAYESEVPPEQRDSAMAGATPPVRRIGTMPPVPAAPSSSTAVPGFSARGTLPPAPAPAPFSSEPGKPVISKVNKAVGEVAKIAAAPLENPAGAMVSSVTEPAKAYYTLLQFANQQAKRTKLALDGHSPDEIDQMVPRSIGAKDAALAYAKVATVVAAGPGQRILERLGLRAGLSVAGAAAGAGATTAAAVTAAYNPEHPIAGAVAGFLAGGIGGYAGAREAPMEGNAGGAAPAKGGASGTAPNAPNAPTGPTAPAGGAPPIEIGGLAKHVSIDMAARINDDITAGKTVHPQNVDFAKFVEANAHLEPRLFNDALEKWNSDHGIEPVTVKPPPEAKAEGQTWGEHLNQQQREAQITAGTRQLKDIYDRAIRDENLGPAGDAKAKLLQDAALAHVGADLGHQLAQEQKGWADWAIANQHLSPREFLAGHNEFVASHAPPGIEYADPTLAGTVGTRRMGRGDTFSVEPPSESTAPPSAPGGQPAPQAAAAEAGGARRLGAEGGAPTMDRPRVYVPESSGLAVTEEQALTRNVARGLKAAHPDAIAQAAPEMAKRVPPNALLVPLPDHQGNTAANMALAQAIAKQSGSDVIDALTRSAQSQSSRELRQKGKPGLTAEEQAQSITVRPDVDPKMLHSTLQPVVFVDNLETTGATMEGARRAIGRDGIPLVYAQAPVPAGEQPATASHDVAHDTMRTLGIDPRSVSMLPGESFQGESNPVNAIDKAYHELSTQAQAIGRLQGKAKKGVDVSHDLTVLQGLHQNTLEQVGHLFGPEVSQAVASHLPVIPKAATLSTEGEASAATSKPSTAKATAGESAAAGSPADADLEAGAQKPAAGAEPAGAAGARAGTTSTRTVERPKPEPAPERITPGAEIEGPQGHETQVRFGDGSTVGAQYRVVEGASLIPSHHPISFEHHEGYPAGVQGREYKGARGRVNREQVETETARLRPDVLLDAGASVSEGPPLVTKHGIAVGGNQRTMMLQRAYEAAGPSLSAEPTRAQAYKQALIERAHQFGLNPEHVRAMKAPVLVRQITDPSIDVGSREELARLNQLSDVATTKAKDELTAAQGRVQQLARADVALRHLEETIDPEESIRDYLSTKAGHEFVRLLFADAVLQPQERGEFIEGSKDGDRITEGGKRQIEALLRVAAVGDADTVFNAPASIIRKLDSAIPAILRANAIPRYSLQPFLRAALGLLGRGAAGQQSMFEAEDPAVIDMARMLERDKKADVTKTFREYASTAEGAQRAVQSEDMFGYAPESPDDARQRLIKEEAPAYNRMAALTQAQNELAKAEAAFFAYTRDFAPDAGAQSPLDTPEGAKLLDAVATARVKRDGLLARGVSEQEMRYEVHRPVPTAIDSDNILKLTSPAFEKLATTRRLADYTGIPVAADNSGRIIDVGDPSPSVTEQIGKGQAHRFEIGVALRIVGGKPTIFFRGVTVPTGTHPLAAERITPVLHRAMDMANRRAEGRLAEPDMFGYEAPAEKKARAKADQTSMFGGTEGTEASRPLANAERAAQSELERLRQEALLVTDPEKSVQLAQRVAQLTKLVDRNASISSAEMALRARAEGTPTKTTATTSDIEEAERQVARAKQLLADLEDRSPMEQIGAGQSGSYERLLAMRDSWQQRLDELKKAAPAGPEPGQGTLFERPPEYGPHRAFKQFDIGLLWDGQPKPEREALLRSLGFHHLTAEENAGKPWGRLQPAVQEAANAKMQQVAVGRFGADAARSIPEAFLQSLRGMLRERPPEYRTDLEANIAEDLLERAVHLPVGTDMQVKLPAEWKVRARNFINRMEGEDNPAADTLAQILRGDPASLWRQPALQEYRRILQKRHGTYDANSVQPLQDQLHGILARRDKPSLIAGLRTLERNGLLAGSIQPSDDLADVTPQDAYDLIASAAEQHGADDPDVGPRREADDLREAIAAFGAQAVREREDRYGPGHPRFASFAEMQDALRKRASEREYIMTRALGDLEKPVRLPTRGGGEIIVHHSARKPGTIQVSHFAQGGLPTGHEEYPNLAEARKDLNGEALVDWDALAREFPQDVDPNQWPRWDGKHFVPPREQEPTYSGTPEAARKKAVAEFGTTEDVREAGWLFPDGTMLDFSGKNDGGPSGTRTRDHREIGAAYDYEPGHTAAMSLFRTQGNVRFGMSRPNHLSVDIAAGTLTEPQFARIRQALRSQPSLAIDVRNADGERIADYGFEERQGGIHELRSWLEENGAFRPDSVRESEPTYRTPFYSRLKRAIDNAPFEKGTTEQWRAALSKNVAKSEREYTGLDKVLNAASDDAIFTKEELAQAFRAGELHTKTKVLGRGATADDVAFAESGDRLRATTDALNAAQGQLLMASRHVPVSLINGFLRQIVQNDTEPTAESLAVWEPKPEDIPLARAYYHAWRQWELARDTHDQLLAATASQPDGYEQYTEPGGTNYRTFLITLDRPIPPPEEPLRVETDDAGAKVVDAKGRTYGHYYGNGEAQILGLARQRGPTQSADPYYRGMGEAPPPLTELPEEYHTIRDANQPPDRQYGVTLPNQEHARPWNDQRFPTAALARAYGLRVLNEQRADDFARKFLEEHPDFEESHYHVHNVLAHLRTKDRQVGQEKVLFLEELQSQWHELGHRFGYRSTAPQLEWKAVEPPPAGDYNYYPRKWQAPRPGGGTFTITESQSREGLSSRFVLTSSSGGFPGTSVYANERSLEAAQREAQKHAQAAEETKVPHGPFKKTEEWLGLAMKKAIDEAVRGDYDRIAWTTGEQQAQRYSLEKVVDRITYEPDSGSLTAWKNGSNVHSGKYDARALPSVIGKEAAERLLASAPQVTDPTIRAAIEQVRALGLDPLRASAFQIEEAGGSRELSNFIYTHVIQPGAMPALESFHELKGDDLKVGGQGMRVFYDQMVPIWVRDYTKKLLGQALPVEQTPVVSGDRSQLRWRDVQSMSNDVGGEARFLMGDVAEAMRDAPDMRDGPEGVTWRDALSFVRDQLNDEFTKNPYPESAFETVAAALTAEEQRRRGKRGALTLLEVRDIARAHATDGVIGEILSGIVEAMQERDGDNAAWDAAGGEPATRVTWRYVMPDVRANFSGYLASNPVGGAEDFQEVERILSAAEESPPGPAVMNPSFAITPELRKKVLSEGQMLLEPRASYDANQLDAFTDLTPAQKQALNDGEAKVAYGSVERRDAVAEAYKRIAEASFPTSRERLGQVRKAKARPWVELRGQTLASPSDMVRALQAYRDPLAERMHVILLDDDNKVVAHTVDTSGALNFVDVGGKRNDMAPWVQAVISRAKRLGVTRVLMAHNHPSGDPTASEPDKQFTAFMGALLQQHGLRKIGHIVIDHDKGTFIHLVDHGKIGTKLFDRLQTYGTASEADYHDAASQGFKNIDTPQEAAKYVRAVAGPDHLTVMYVDSQHRLIAVEPRPASSTRSVHQWLESSAKAHGAARVFLAGPMEDMQDIAKRALASSNSVTPAARLGGSFRVQVGGWGSYIADLLAVREPPFKWADAFQNDRVVVNSLMEAGDFEEIQHESPNNTPLRRLRERPPAYVPGGNRPGTGLRSGVPEARAALVKLQSDAAAKVAKLSDDTKRLLNPTARGLAGEGASLILRHQVGEHARRVEQAATALEAFRRTFERLPEPDRWEFVDRMEYGKPQATAELDHVARIVRGIMDSLRDQIRALGTGKLEQFIEHYFPHVWADPDKAAVAMGVILGKRPLEGPKSFLKQRKIPTIREGMQGFLDEDPETKFTPLTPISENPLDMVLLKAHEMSRYLMAQRVLRNLKDEGLATFVPAFGHAPRGFSKIDDRVAMVYGPSELAIWEGFDAKIRQALDQVIKAYGFKHERHPVIGGDRAGYAEMGFGRMVTKFGGSEGTVAHELGHLLDGKFGFWDRLVGRPAKRLQTKGKNAGKMVPDAKEPKEEKARRIVMRKELRALADMRHEGMDADDVPGHARVYVRKRVEQIANMVDAYVTMRSRFKEVAPTVFAAFDSFVRSIPELKPIVDVTPSVARGEGMSRLSVGGLVTKGQFWAPEQAAFVLNHYLSPGMRGNAVYDAVRGTGNLLNVVQLGLSAFHLGFTTMDAMVSRSALALMHLADGKPLAALGDVATTIAAPFSGLAKGDKVLQEYLHPGTQGAQFAAIVDALVKGGGRVRMDSFYRVGDKTGADHWTQFWRAARQAKVAGALWHLPLAFIQALPHLVLEVIVPRQKLGVFADLAQLELERLQRQFPTMAAEDPAQWDVEVKAAMARVWDSVDNRMGQLVYDNLFWHRITKDAAMVLIRSVGWNLGTFRELGGGMLDLANVPSNLARGTPLGRRLGGGGAGKKPPTGGGVGAGGAEMEPRPKHVPSHPRVFSTKAAYLLVLPVVTWVAGVVTQYLYTGEGPDSLEDGFYPKTGRTDANGNIERMVLPTYWKDILSYSRHPMVTLGNKLQPALSFAYEAISNRDFYGNKVRNEDDDIPKQIAQIIQFAERELPPFAVQNIAQASARGQGTGQKVAGFFGVTMAPQEVVRTEAQELMHRYRSEQGHAALTPEAQQQSDARRKLGQLYQQGGINMSDIRRLEHGGQLTPQQGKKITMRMGFPPDDAFRGLEVPAAAKVAREYPLGAAFGSLTLDQMQAVYDLGNEQEQRLWLPILRDRKRRQANRQPLNTEEAIP